jgi:hypothetical protein
MRRLRWVPVLRGKRGTPTHLRISKQTIHEGYNLLPTRNGELAETSHPETYPLVRWHESPLSIDDPDSIVWHADSFCFCV